MDALARGGGTALYEACLSGAVRCIGPLLAAGAQVGACGSRGATPLFVAAQAGHTEVVHLLLAAGAAVDEEAAYPRRGTPLYAAATRGHLEVMQELLQGGASPNNARNAPLLAAAYAGHAPCVDLLLQAGADVNAASLTMGETALHHAAARNHPACMELLLRGGAQVDATPSRTRATPLYAAVQAGHVACVRQLLAAGATVDGAMAGHVLQRRSPLLAASAAGATEVVAALLEAGASVSAAISCCRGSVGRPLAVAVHEEAQPSCVPLLAAAAPLSELQLACAAAATDRVLAALRDGGDCGAPDARGATALHVAAHVGSEACLRALLATVVSQPTGSGPAGLLDAQERALGETPLHMAARRNHSGCVRLLLQAGARVDVRRQDTRTALAVAAELGHAASVSAILEEAGIGSANVAMLPVFRPLSLAAQRGHTRCVAILLEAGVASKVSDLSRAITNRHDACALLLIRATADPHRLDGCLVEAAAHGRNSLVLAMLEAGCRMDTCQGWSPLGAAVEYGRARTVELLCTEGADLGVVHRRQGYREPHVPGPSRWGNETTLARAIAGGKDTVVALLQGESRWRRRRPLALVREQRVAGRDRQLLAAMIAKQSKC